MQVHDDLLKFLRSSSAYMYAEDKKFIAMQLAMIIVLPVLFVRFDKMDGICLLFQYDSFSLVCKLQASHAVCVLGHWLWLSNLVLVPKYN